jgi:5-methylthioadenosine/S-adenosylhomocysteine deaminase
MNLLIKNATLLPIAGEEEVVEGVNIFIEGDKIKYIGKDVENFYPDKVIDAKGDAVLPGFVNAHTHIAMSLLRNYADDLPLYEWLTKKIWPVEAKLTAEDVYWGSMLSIVEMIRSGITCFADMYFFMEEVGEAVKESGVRGILSRGLIEEPNKDIDNKEKLNYTRNLYKDWNGKADGRIRVMVAPHAPYTCSPKYLEKIMDLTKELNAGIHIHLSETKKEVEDSIEQYGKSPVEHVYNLGLFQFPTVAAHCVHVSDEDIDILSENNVSAVNNPSSNLKLASGFAPVESMIDKGVNVALGTDGSSSNNNLNMFEEIHIAAIVNKSVNESATSIPAITALKMATINGARALNWDDEIGSIEVGKKADIIIVDMDKPHLCPRHNVVSALAYSAQASDVKTMIVDGKIIMEDYDIKTIDVEKVMYNTEKHAKDLISR